MRSNLSDRGDSAGKPVNMRALPTGLPKTVLILGLVSFFTDLSSEMIYPLLPIFLASVMWAGAVAIGVIEGIAESTAAFFKLVSGIWTDRLKRRKPFILSGYGISGVARPLIGFASVWPAVMFLRFVDRMGKGVRTSPRDALIADVVGTDKRGEAYGFHRAMDHAGAVLGPHPQTSATSPIFSESLRARIKDAHFEMSALAVAVQLELNAVQHYREQAARAALPEVRAFYEQLVQWESGHYHALVAQQQSLQQDYWHQNGFERF